MKVTLAIIALCIWSSACGKPPQPFEIKDVCSQPTGTNVVIQGYISLPKAIDTIQITKGGRITQVGYQMFVMTKADATGDAVKATFWTSDKGDPNSIKPLPRNYTWNDLIVVSDDGKEVRAGKEIKVTGEVTPDEKTGCGVGVAKIEAL